jgi:hypothetical protein
MSRFALLGVLQNDAAPIIIDNSPFLDLLQGSKAAETGEVVVQAAISYARGSSGAVDITHGRAQLRGIKFNHTCKRAIRQCVTLIAVALQ